MSGINMDYRLYLWSGIVASIIVGAGEYLLHYDASGPGGEVDMLLNIPLSRARVGHFVAIFGIPFYFSAYYGIFKLFKSTRVCLAKGLLVSGALSFIVGGIWLSSRYFAAVVLQKSQDTAYFDYFYLHYVENYQVLVWVLRGLILAVSVFYSLLILKSEMGLPKWLAFFNPVVILLLVFSTLIWIKPLAVHIVPIAMNITHFVFFSLLLYFSNPHVLKESAD